MNRIKRLFLYLIPVFFLISCSVSYSFQGGKISPDIKTIKIVDFVNQATLVYPPLTQVFNQELRSRMIEQTSLKETKGNADLEFEGEITGYDVMGTAVKEDAFASRTKLTITIKVRYINNVKPEDSLEQTFSAYQEFDAGKSLDEVQDQLIRVISKELVDMIFNATVGSW